jgi:hypothetical protein
MSRGGEPHTTPNQLMKLLGSYLHTLRWLTTGCISKNQDNLHGSYLIFEYFGSGRRKEEKISDTDFAEWLDGRVKVHII